MGGLAFFNHNPPFPTPRMPPEIFNIILTRTITVLRIHYAHVISPIEAPGKETFGDVDVLVSNPYDSAYDFARSQNDTAEHLKNILNADAFIATKGSPIIIFAVPWPNVVSRNEKFEGKRYVQIDIHPCSSHEQLLYTYFHQSHGDLWNILGIVMRPFGLTVNNVGLYLRIPAIESKDRKKSMVFLSSDPKAILEFLGLEESKWWKQFDSCEQIFEYAATCRMFFIETTDTDDAVNFEGGRSEVFKKNLNGRTRARIANRPTVTMWIEKFMPAYHAKGSYTVPDPPLTRELIRYEAFKTFGVGAEYELREREWKLAQHNDIIWREKIRGGVPVEGVNPALRAAAIRVLKAAILEGEEWDDNIPKRDESGFFNTEKVARWVTENWEIAGNIGLMRQRERSIQKAKEMSREVRAG